MGGKATNGAVGLWGHPKTLHPDSSPGTHHNLSLCRVGMFEPSSEAVTKCHLH